MQHELVFATGRNDPSHPDQRKALATHVFADHEMCPNAVDGAKPVPDQANDE